MFGLEVGAGIAVTLFLLRMISVAHHQRKKARRRERIKLLEYATGTESYPLPELRIKINPHLWLGIYRAQVKKWSIPNYVWQYTISEYLAAGGFSHSDLERVTRESAEYMERVESQYQEVA